jgi:competence ComEA-like helix-hairpin-helix protein
VKERALAILLCGTAAAQDPRKALLERTCTKCHDLEATLRQHNTRERWAEIVDEMVSRGMEASDLDIEKIINYLAKTQGAKVKVNQARAEELAAVLEVPLATAAAVVDYRTRQGTIKSFEELKRVPALQGRNIDGKKDGLDFSAPH